MVTKIALTDDLTIQTVRLVQPQLLAALSSIPEIEIDLSAVDEIDSAGLLDLTEIVEFTHLAESVLDRIRRGELMLSEEPRQLSFDVTDYIAALIELAAMNDVSDAQVPHLIGTVVQKHDHRRAPPVSLLA